MGNSTFDCYLCGTSNPGDADFCVQCGGQLLKLPEAAEDEPSELVGEFESDENVSLSNFDSTDLQPLDGEFDVEPVEKKPKRKVRKVQASFEDQRLSDALGLTEDVDDSERLDEIQADVTSIPTVRGAENIPVIGTTAGTGFFTSRGDEEVGPIAWVIVGMLFIAVGWLGYDSLFRDPPRPDTIGFVEATIPETTTTQPVVEVQQPATADEVNSQYRSAFVRVIPFGCTAGVGEALSDPVAGIAINERSVLVPANLPVGTNAIRIVTRTGGARTALLSQQGDFVIATSDVQTTRNLEIEDVASETTFYVNYDAENGDITTTPESLGLDAEIQVSEFGHVHRVVIGGQTANVQQLVDIDLSVELAEDATAGQATTCASTAGLVFATPDAESTGSEDSAPEDTETNG